MTRTDEIFNIYFVFIGVSFFVARANPGHKAQNRCLPSQNDDIAGRGERGIFLSFRNHGEPEPIVFLARGAGFLIPIGSSANLFATFRGD